MSSAKKELLKMVPTAISVVFLDSRPNQEGRNGWLNFAGPRDCENFIKEIRKNPPKNGLAIKKTVEHQKPSRKSFLAAGTSGSVLQEWKNQKFPLLGKDINFNNVDETRCLSYKKTLSPHCYYFSN